MLQAALLFSDVNYSFCYIWRFYESAVEGRSLRSSAVDDDDDSGDDEAEEGKDYSWKKTIMIGPSYQASVPAGTCSYDDTPPYENEDKRLWDPDRCVDLEELLCSDYI